MLSSVNPLDRFLRDNLFNVRDPKQLLQNKLMAKLKQGNGATITTQQTELDDRQKLKLYVGQLSLRAQEQPTAYMFMEKDNNGSAFAIYKEPEGPYEIYPPHKSSPMQIVNSIQFYAAFEHFVKSSVQGNELSLIEFILQPEKEEVEPPKKKTKKRRTSRSRTKKKQSKVEASTTPKKGKKRKAEKPKGKEEEGEEVAEEQQQQQQEEKEVEVVAEEQEPKETAEPPKKKKKKRATRSASKKK